MIGTYISEWEKPHFSQVDDKELNELLQAVRAKFNNQFYIQTIQYDRRTWWDKLTENYKKTGKLYTLYFMLNDIDAQVINFPQSHEWSINTMVDKSYIMTYFLGMLSGQNYKS
jgi:hypothetical protein